MFPSGSKPSYDDAKQRRNPFSQSTKTTIIRLTDDQGNTFTGKADTFSAEYGMHEFGTEEEGIRLGEYLIFRSQIKEIKILPMNNF